MTRVTAVDAFVHRPRNLIRLATAAALGLAGLTAPLTALAHLTPAADAAAPAYTVTTYHFLVHVGPGRSTACDVVGDLYLPRNASPRHRVPAILTTNGFGGSKADQAGIGKAFASRGFAVLAYSGLGFGGSGCQITLDDPQYDGAAASQLVSYLGGARGIAFTDADHTHRAPVLHDIVLDRRDHQGKHGRHVAHDPRVGMIGGSYGGEVQFAAADVDPRIDTIVPLITWNDLSYSLAPNNTTLTQGVTSSTPGAVKLVWGLGFSGEGVADGVEGAEDDPSRLMPCPNFPTFVCSALATGGSTGYFQPDTIAAMRHASVSTYMKRIRIPVLLMQGEKDTLFNLNEAAATYRALRRQHTPVKMVWQSWGHSDLTPAHGELNLDSPNPRTQYETARILSWFDRYLRGAKVSTGPAFSYFRDWVHYRGIARPAYASARRFPIGTSRSWFFNGTDRLTPDPTPTQERNVTPGSQTFVTPPAGAPTGLDDVDLVNDFFSGAEALPNQTAPGTYATWQTTKLTSPVEVVGTPRASFQVQTDAAVASQNAGPAGDLVLFARMVDIAPDGTLSDIDGEIAPIRIPHAEAMIHVALPAIVHRFAAGHAIGLVIGGGSPNYRGNLAPSDVTIEAHSTNLLTLPVVR